MSALSVLSSFMISSMSRALSPFLSAMLKASRTLVHTVKDNVLGGVVVK